MTSEPLIDRLDGSPLKVAEITNYLRRHHWKELSHPNPRLLVFQSGLDDRGHPIQLVLPSQDIYEDAPYLITKSIKLLSTLQAESVQETLERILRFQQLPTQPAQAQS